MCGAMNDVSKNEGLGEDEAYDLFRTIRTGVNKDGANTALGQKFRNSYWYYEVEIKSPAWEAKDKYHLPIDDILSILMSRNKPPYIGQTKNDNSSPLRLCGPYALVRTHLYHFASFVPDPAYEREKAYKENAHLNEIVAAAKALALVSGKPWWDIGNRQRHRERLAAYTGVEGWDQTLPELTATAKAAIDAQTKLDAAFDALQQLYDIAEAELALIQMQPSTAGRPRLLWKEHFVWCVAHVWRLITGTEPSRSEESHYGEFVYACWNSFDDEMPEVSFARAIRSFDLTKSPITLR
jgi:hypothetical protein